MYECIYIYVSTYTHSRLSSWHIYTYTCIHTYTHDGCWSLRTHIADSVRDIHIYISCVYVCESIYVYICMYITNIYVSTYTHSRLSSWHTNIYIYGIQMHTYMCVWHHRCIRICVSICVSDIHMHTYVFLCVHEIPMHMYICLYVHT